MRVSVSGTHFTSTMTFTCSRLRSIGVALEQEAGVGAAEAERVAQGVAELGRTGGVGRVVEVALGVGVLVVDGRRDELVLERESGDGGLGRAGGAQEVSGHRLGRADRDSP